MLTTPSPSASIVNKLMPHLETNLRRNTEMKERFKEAARVYREKYGPCNMDNFTKDMSIEKVEDTITLFFKLGELHNEHHRQLADRKYQQEWRDSNREAVRTYQRNYARKRRGTSPEMYRLSE